MASKNDDDSPRYTARSLGALCDVSERTVRYYVEEGLLPAPAARGRGANFDDDHLTRLRLIRAMQQTGNDLETIGEYLRELELGLAETGASLESALAVWDGRSERIAWREQWARRFGRPEAVHRYRVVDGVELLVDAAASPTPLKMQNVLRQLRAAFEPDD